MGNAQRARCAALAGMGILRISLRVQGLLVHGPGVARLRRVDGRTGRDDSGHADGDAP